MKFMTPILWNQDECSIKKEPVYSMLHVDIMYYENDGEPVGW